jgi:hypothetical protein
MNHTATNTADTATAKETSFNMDIYWYCNGLAAKLADFALGAPCESGERFLARLGKRITDIRAAENAARGGAGWADPLWSVEPGAFEVAEALGMNWFMATA